MGEIKDLKKLLTIIFMFVIILTGCSHIKPIDVIITDYDLSEAEIIMRRTWKPVYEMTNANLETNLI